MAPAARYPKLERTMERVKTRRTIQALTAILAGAGFAAVYLRSYLVARYRGEKADLHDCILIQAPLSGANLKRANLRRARLTGARLQGAELYDANLGAADLACAELGHADVCDATLAGANLSRSVLSGANL